MAHELRFTKIDGLRLHPTESHTFLKAEGLPEVIEALKKKLTVQNKAVGYRIMKLRDQLIFWQPRAPFSEVATEKLVAIQAEISELEPQKEVKYYYDANGDVYVPAGCWWLGDVVDDHHLNKDVPLVLLDGLRDYQVEGLTELLRYKRSTLVLATGLGKSIIIANIAKTMALSGKRTMIVVPSDYLVGQIADTIKRYHPSVAAVSSSRKISLGKDILVTTVGTAVKYADVYDCIVIDEGHHNPAETWTNLLSNVEKAEYVYNFTATPIREDGMTMGIHAFGGKTVFKRDAEWGIKNDWLCHFDVYCRVIKSRNSKGEEITVSDKALRTTANKKLVGNTYFLTQVSEGIMSAVQKGRKVIVLGTSLEPLRLLSKICKGKVDFSVANADFKKPLHDFVAGDTNILVATSKLISEGIDVPGADVMFLLTNHSSDVMTYQALGRILRKSEGKPKPLVIDCVAWNYAGFLNSFEKRMKIWQKLADNVNTTQVQ